MAESSEPVKKTRGKGGRGGRGGKKKAKENDDKENGSRQNKENVLVPVAGGNKGKKGSKKENKPKKEKKVKKPRAKRSKKQARGDESESQDSEDFAKQERRMSASIVAQRKAERFRKLSVAHFIGRSAFEVSDEDVMVVDNSVCVKPAFNSGGVAPASQVFSMSIPALSQWSMPADYPFFVVVLFANEGSLKYQVRDAPPRDTRGIPLQRKAEHVFLIGQTMYHTKHVTKPQWTECVVTRVEYKKAIYIIYDEDDAQEVQVPWSLASGHLRIKPEAEVLEQKDLPTLSTILVKPPNNGQPASSSSSSRAPKQKEDRKSWRIVNTDSEWEARIIVTVPEPEV